ncbi:MAG: hypothetical protein Q4C61_11640 [Lachnospiraceae bacterium]|nr:hypothetical protein [Lachnospiraceae bacterium]
METEKEPVPEITKETVKIGAAAEKSAEAATDTEKTANKEHETARQEEEPEKKKNSHVPAVPIGIGIIALVLLALVLYIKIKRPDVWNAVLPGREQTEEESQTELESETEPESQEETQIESESETEPESQTESEMPDTMQNVQADSEKVTENSEAQVLLGHMSVLDFSEVYHFDETSVPEDLAGTIYESGNVFCLGSKAETCAYLEIENNGQYRSVGGIAAVSNKMPEGQESGGWLEIYVKDTVDDEYRRIYASSQELGQDPVKETFGVDIAGSSSVKFCAARPDGSRHSFPLLLADVCFDRTDDMVLDGYTSEPPHSDVLSMLVDGDGENSAAASKSTMYGEAISHDALSVDDKVEYIRGWYNTTWNTLDSLSVAEEENGKKAYYDGESCVKVTVQPGGLDSDRYPGAERLIADYYYRNGLLYFVFLHWNEEEYRYYLEYQSGDLCCIRYIDADGVLRDYPEKTLLSDINSETAPLCGAGEDF